MVSFAMTDEAVIIDLKEVKNNAESVIIELIFENKIEKMVQVSGKEK